MRICFLGPASNVHIIKWCGWFSSHGHEVHVISFIPGEISDAKVHLIDIGVDVKGSDAGKLKYLLTGGKIRKLVREIQPDIVNVHYASSYGAAAAMSGLKGYVLSVWGSDVYDFPKKSPLHKALLKYSLRRAGYLFSTSRAMAEETSKYTSKRFEITPFGVDMELFSPDKRTREDDSTFVVGTVKSLSDKYGIRYLLEAVAAVKKKGEIPIRLRIAGKGPQEEEYRRLAERFGISDITDWLGFISQAEAATEWANMDIAVIPSALESESFGVAAVEAQACGTAVIISDIPGLMEATKPGLTSKVVPREDAAAIAAAITILYRDKALREKMGAEGSRFVRANYELDQCFLNIEKLFNEIKDRR